MYRAAVQLALKGIVAKRIAAPYHPVERTKDWLSGWRGAGSGSAIGFVVLGPPFVLRSGPSAAASESMVPIPRGTCCYRPDHLIAAAYFDPDIPSIYLWVMVCRRCWYSAGGLRG